MGKNNYHLKNIKEGTKVESYSIKKFKVGAASVVIGASIFFGAGAVAQASESVSNNTVTDESLGTEKKLEVAPKAQAKPVVENTRESLSAALASKLENSEKETLNKVALTKLIEEIDGKFANGKYASKTEESVNQLKAVLEEARTALNNAKTQDELSQAQAKLVVATTKLQTKPEEKKEAPAVDTTNGKSTVGKKATNTEKAADTNSIANSGSRDERNGKALDKNNPFRTDTAPNTSTSTDPLAVNETPKSVANQYFDEGVEKPTGNEKLKLQPAANLTGWKFENPNQNKIIIANGSTTYYGNQMFPSNHRYGIVLGGFTGIGSSTKFDNIGSIYQDIDVVPNSELVLRMRGATFGTQGGPSTYKAEIFDVNNLTTPLGKIDGVRARPAEFSGIVNIPEGVTKVRIKLTDTNPNQKGIGDGRDPYVDIDGVKVYTGAMVANFRASSGSYVVPTVGQTNYTTASESRNQATVETTITVNLENKGGESSQNSIYRVQLPEGATLKENSAQNATATVSNGVLSLNAGAIAAGTTKTISYTLVLPATAPLSKDLQGTVSYQTTNLSILNPTIPRKSGSRALENQNITITMYKDDLQAEAAKAATLNQSDYTPEAWAAYQAEIAKAREILNEEKNNVAIANRKNQADINTQTLLLQKAQAKLEIDKAKKEKLAAIEGTPNATKEEKDAAKQAAQDAATKADKAIDAAADNAGVTTAQTEGTAAVEAVSPTVAAKDAAKAEVAKKLAEKLAAIESTPNATKEEKDAAKQAAQDAATKADKAIDAATDNAGVTTAQTEGIAAVEAVSPTVAVNPVGKEKAKAAVDAALAEKAKAIEANDKLSDAEKAAAKAEAKKAADEAKKAIEAATDQAGVDAKAAEGTKAVEAVNPVGKEKAKAAVDGELAKKLAELENSTDLTDAEKAEAKKAADEAKKAIEAIEKATTQAEVEQVIRNFVYHIPAVVLEKEEYDLSKLFVNGTVIVKQGEVLTDKDILSKLNLPEGVEVVKVEKPETAVLGKGTAKVTLKLADGTQVTITVPVTVVEGTTVNTSDVAKSDATEKSSNNVSKKQLPNTGTTETNTGLAGLGLGILGGLFAAARRRKNDKN